MLKASPVEIKWNSGLPVYASERFLKTVGEEYGWVGGTDDAGQLRCVLPYTILRKFCFRFVRFRVETIPLQGELSLEEEKSFLNSSMQYFRSIGADMIVPASNNSIFRTYPDGAVVAPYGTFIIDLRRPEETLLSEVSENYRKQIRRAATAGVHVVSGMEYLDTAYDLTAETLRRSGIKFKAHSEFRKHLLQGLGDNVNIFIAKYQGAIQACLVAPFSKYCGFSWYGGTIAEPIRGAMHLLHWEAMRTFRELGVQRFNFTGVRINPEKGSKQEGIMNFKMRFGGTLTQGYMWKYSFSALKFGAYWLAIRILKGGDTVDREQHKLEKNG